MPRIAKTARTEKGSNDGDALEKWILLAVQDVCWLDCDMDTEDMKISSILFLCSHFNSH